VPGTCQIVIRAIGIFLENRFAPHELMFTTYHSAHWFVNYPRRQESKYSVSRSTCCFYVLRVSELYRSLSACERVTNTVPHLRNLFWMTTVFLHSPCRVMRHFLISIQPSFVWGRPTIAWLLKHRCFYHYSFFCSCGCIGPVACYGGKIRRLSWTGYRVMRHACVFF
jgi:hypothetical protein